MDFYSRLGFPLPHKQKPTKKFLGRRKEEKKQWTDECGEKDWHRDKQTQRHTQTIRHPETHSETKTKTERVTQRLTHTHTERDKDEYIESHAHGQRHTHINTQTKSNIQAEHQVDIHQYSQQTCWIFIAAVEYSSSAKHSLRQIQSLPSWTSFAYPNPLLPL